MSQTRMEKNGDLPRGNMPVMEVPSIVEHLLMPLFEKGILTDTKYLEQAAENLATLWTYTEYLFHISSLSSIVTLIGTIMYPIKIVSNGITWKSVLRPTMATEIMNYPLRKEV